MSKIRKLALFVLGYIIHLSLTAWIFYRFANCGILTGCVTQMDRIIGKMLTFPLFLLSDAMPWKGTERASNIAVSWDIYFLMWPINSLIVVTAVYFVLKYFFDRTKRSMRN